MRCCHFSIVFIVFTYALPYIGSSTLTYNGKDSQTSIVLRTVNDISISFDIRTRQVNAFIMGVVKSNDEYFLVGFKNGNLLLSSNISRQFTAAQVAAASNGQWMNVSIVKNSSSADAIITINSLPRLISTTVFGSNWTNFVMSQNLTIGLYNSTIVSEDYGNVALEGSLTNVIIGGIHYNLVTDGISTPSVVNGSQSSRDVCAEQPCKNNRTCHDDFNDFRCDCGSFYTFKTCNETVNVTCAFKTDLCQNGGSCMTLDSSQAINPPVYSDNGVDLFKCNCIAGYNGTFCEKNIDECLFGFCQNSNNCTDLINDYQCNCAAGWTSKNCTTEIDECNSIPCKNGGTCKDLFNDFNCTCTSAWSGPTCTTDVDECAANIHECKRNSTCKNIDGDYECICLEGTTGNRCQLDAPDDDEIEAWVIGVAVAGGLLVIILLILLCWLCLYFRKNSGMEGTYSPNKEEQQSGNVEMNTLKKPNAERLI